MVFHVLQSPTSPPSHRKRKQSQDDDSPSAKKLKVDPDQSAKDAEENVRKVCLILPFFTCVHCFGHL